LDRFGSGLTVEVIRLARLPCPQELINLPSTVNGRRVPIPEIEEVVCSWRWYHKGRVGIGTNLGLERWALWETAEPLKCLAGCPRIRATMSAGI
jgi:hypothetical protein